MRNKALISYYLFNANICIDSLLYIESVKDVYFNFDLDGYIEEKITLFYTNLRYLTELLEKEFDMKKKLLKNDKIFQEIFYTTDKNIVHKDDNYVYTLTTLQEKIPQLKTHLEYTYHFVKERELILKYFKIQYRCFDSILFRIVNPFINYGFINTKCIYYESDTENPEVKIFNKPELLKEENYKKDIYGVELSNGINEDETKINYEKILLLEQIKWNTDFSEYMNEVLEYED